MQKSDEKDVEIFVSAIKESLSCDFSNYSVSSLKRRLTKIMTDRNITLDNLIDGIRKDGTFAEKIVNCITVCTTELFRDPEVWINLKEELVPRYSEKNLLRLWHAGCSTGQEVYSMMILLSELNLLEKTEIYATDINQDALDTASKGIYKYRFNLNYLENFNKVFNDTSKNGNNVKKISFDKYFLVDPVRDTMQIKPFLTEKPFFRRIDLVNDDNPFDVKFDIIVCRNVIIYFNYELQNKVFNLFYRNMQQNGCLLIGNHENIIGTYSNFFQKKAHLYFKINSR